MTTDNTDWLHPYDRNGTWYAYWIEDGKRKYRSLKVKAQRHVAKAMVKLAAELVAEAGKGKMPTLATYAADMFTPTCKWIQRRAIMGHKIKESTLQFYRRALVQHILPAHGDRTMDTIDAAAIEDLAASLTINNAYKNEVMRTYKIVMDEAARDKIVPPMAAPGRFAKAPKPKDVLTDQDLETLFPDDPAALEQIWRGGGRYEPPHAGLMFGAMYALMVSTGMRSGEARGLQLDHVFLDQAAVAIVQAFDIAENIGPLKKASATNDRARVAIIPDRTARALGWWLAVRQGQTPYVFEYCGHHIARELILNRFLDVTRRAGVADGRNITPHSLRYTYNTRMENKLPGEVLRSIVGHRSEEMTAHYSRPVLAERIKDLAHHQAAVNRFWT